MKKLYTFKTFLALVLIAVGFNTALAQDTLAVWTFDQWPGGEPPAGQEIDKPIFANGGFNAATAQIGSEYMFSDGGEGEVRVWGTPSAGGYVRTANMVVGTYYRVIGISTANYRNIKVSGNFGTDSSSRPYYLQLQYRVGSEDAWANVGEPVNVTSTSQSSMPKIFDDVELPTGANNITVLELRFIVTALGGSNAQGRVSELVVIGSKIATDINTIQTEKIRVYNANGKLAINGASGSNVQVYSLTGAKLFELKRVNDSETISLPTGQIYLVRVNNQSFKVKL